MQASEDFYSTILQPFQFEPERKKTVDNEKETTEAVVSRNSLKWVFLKISQISQENANVGVSFNKIPSLKVCSFIKKRFQHWCFPVKFAIFLRTRFFTEHLQWLLLKLNILMLEL